MTLTGFWNRIEKWVYSLESRNELVFARQELNERLQLYEEVVCVHSRFGRRINRNHVFAFRFIVRRSLEEIEERLDVMNILESA